MMNTTAYDTGTAYLFRVHLDTTRVLEDSVTPDPAWVLELTWGKTPPEGQTTQDYLASCKREAELLAALDPRIVPAPQEISLPI